MKLPDVNAVPLYKYVPFDTLKHILAGSIRFTQPSAFNDPFELLPEVIVPDGETEHPISVSFDLMAARIARLPDEPEEVPTGCTSSDIISRDIVQQLNSVIGFLCLSRNRDSLPMWAHYAEQYTGAVVEFDGAHEAFGSQIDVEYHKARSRLTLDKYVAGDPIPIAELCVKSDHWAYENEVRLACRFAECEQQGADGRGFPVFVRRFPLPAIKHVILGERMAAEAQQFVYNLVKDTHIGLSFAAVSNTGYQIREERIKAGVPVAVMNPWLTPRTAHLFVDTGGQFGEFARWMRDRHPLSKIVNRPV